MLNLNCAVCLDLFKPEDNVDVTKCGHLFHSGCLSMWLKRAKTCPQCRKGCRLRHIIRIYFNTSKSGEGYIDVEALKAKLKNYRQCLSLKQSKCDKLEAELITLKQIERQRRLADGERIKWQEEERRKMEEELEVRLIKPERDWTTNCCCIIYTLSVAAACWFLLSNAPCTCFNYFWLRCVKSM